MTLLTPDQAAARIGICPKTLSRERRAGRIHYYAITGRKIRYSTDDCDSYLASCRKVAQPSERAPVSGRRTARVVPLRGKSFAERYL